MAVNISGGHTPPKMQSITALVDQVIWRHIFIYRNNNSAIPLAHDACVLVKFDTIVYKCHVSGEIWIDCYIWTAGRYQPATQPACQEGGGLAGRAGDKPNITTANQP